jgi:signal peptidase II
VKRRQALIFAAILVSCVGCDYAAKQIAQETLAGSARISFAADILRFELVYNPGAFLSMGSSLPSEVRGLLFLVGVPIALALICGVALRSGVPSTWSLLALALIVGGGLANWLDRLINGGAVTDFVRLELGPLRTGIFNLADVSIVIGAAVFFLAQPRRGRETEQAAFHEGASVPGSGEFLTSASGESGRSSERWWTR